MSKRTAFPNHTQEKITMKQVKDLKLTSQVKLRKFAQSWQIPPIGAEFSEQDLNSQIGTITSALNAGYFINYAIETDDVDLVDDLCKNGADLHKIDQCYGSRVPLQLASDLGRSTIVSILLKYGAIAEGIKVNYSMNPCKQPLTFMWGIMERALGRTVDYDNVVRSLNHRKQKFK